MMALFLSVVSTVVSGKSLRGANSHNHGDVWAVWADDVASSSKDNEVDAQGRPCPTPTPGTCHTIRQHGQHRCQFPFTWEGNTYHRCTDIDHSTFWCFTNQAAGEWGECDLKESTGKDNCLAGPDLTSAPTPKPTPKPTSNPITTGCVDDPTGDIKQGGFTCPTLLALFRSCEFDLGAVSPVSKGTLLKHACPVTCDCPHCCAPPKPTAVPTPKPTVFLIQLPTSFPTHLPSTVPTNLPTSGPEESEPTASPISPPAPTPAPTASPTFAATAAPTALLTTAPPTPAPGCVDDPTGDIKQGGFTCPTLLALFRSCEFDLGAVSPVPKGTLLKHACPVTCDCPHCCAPPKPTRPPTAAPTAAADLTHQPTHVPTNAPTGAVTPPTPTPTPGPTTVAPQPGGYNWAAAGFERGQEKQEKRKQQEQQGSLWSNLIWSPWQPSSSSFSSSSPSSSLSRAQEPAHIDTGAGSAAGRGNWGSSHIWQRQ